MQRTLKFVEVVAGLVLTPSRANGNRLWMILGLKLGQITRLGVWVFQRKERSTADSKILVKRKRDWRFLRGCDAYPKRASLMRCFRIGSEVFVEMESFRENMLSAPVKEGIYVFLLYSVNELKTVPMQTKYNVYKI